ncbi:hypothetical protein QU38_00830, partial [Staphylococcus aureus]
AGRCERDGRHDRLAAHLPEGGRRSRACRRGRRRGDGDDAGGGCHRSRARCALFGAAAPGMGGAPLDAPPGAEQSDRERAALRQIRAGDGDGGSGGTGLPGRGRRPRHSARQDRGSVAALCPARCRAGPQYQGDGA